MTYPKINLQAKTVFAAMKALEANGGEMRASDLFDWLSEKMPLTDYEREQTKSGLVRWKAHLTFYSIEVAKAGYIVKKNGVWHLTRDGVKAISSMDADDFFADFHSKYRALQKDNAHINETEDIEETSNDIDTLQSEASKGIRDYIIRKNPYEFQDLVAALLRAMGYYTPFIAPKGKDGGIDIIAYRDPLGATAPQLKVQVKHYPKTPIDVTIVRNLVGILIKEGEVGVLVTSGTFTSEAKREARNSHRILRLIDIDEFIELWVKYYDKLGEEDKSLLPVIPIYFIKS